MSVLILTAIHSYPLKMIFGLVSVRNVAELYKIILFCFSNFCNLAICAALPRGR